MKTYIFFILRITYIDGLLQYTYNKMQFLEKQGWHVLVFSGENGPILINEFRHFNKYIYKPLFCSPYILRRSEISRTLDSIISDIGDIRDNECVIESGYFPMSIWAEMLASRLNARHLTFLLQESFKFDNKEKDFLRFKYNRHELAGIVNDSIRKMFNDNDIELRDDTSIVAYCNNIFDDCEDTYSRLLDNNADFTFATIGRLSKRCVPAIVEGFYSYASKHSLKRFNIVIIGDSPDGKIKSFIRKRLSELPNVTPVITGNMYPIPISFADNVDVFVSTAGAAIATYKAGFLTVMVNPINGDPVGIIGLDYMLGEKNMYESFSDMKIEDYIDKAINERNNIRFSSDLGAEYAKRMNKEFARHLTFLDSCKENEYYDENKLMEIHGTPSRFPYVHWMLGHILGAEKYVSVLMSIDKFLKFVRYQK